MFTFDQTKTGYANLWDKAKLTHPAQAKAQADRILNPNARAILTQVQNATGVPWFMVGVMLYRESDLNFSTYLGNGQNLNHKTTVVPIGRGPFNTFLDGAIDALQIEGIIGIKDWTIEKILYWIERFNGQGYFGHGNSPYVWSWTSLYTAGKFVRDHVFDPTFVDPQGGCAAILKAIFEAEPALMPPRIASPPAAAPAPATPGEKPPMATVTATPVPAAPGAANLVQITHLLETAVNFIPTISMFFPPLKPLIPFLPMIQGFLAMAEELETAPHDAQAVADIVIKHLQSTAAAVQASKAQAQVAAGVAAPGGSNTTGG